MKLYHYSSNYFDELKTLEMQREITPKEKAEAESSTFRTKGAAPGLYYQHVSFFLERIPTNMPKYYHRDHPFWRAGAEIYEYTIETDDIKAFKYQIVEPPEMTAALMDDNVSPDQFWELMRQLAKDGYVGASSKELVKASKPLMGRMTEFLELAQEVNSKRATSNQYAGSVPHVMVYPKGGIIDIEEVNTMKLKR